MKCDELKPLVFSISDLAYVDEPTPQPNFQDPHDHAVYKATEVDALLAKKDKEIESLKASLYAEMVDADENLRWRKTSEEIPSKKDYYLVSDGKNVFMEYGSYNKQDEVWNWDHGENMDTWKYWRPMPKAPEEAK